MHIGFLTSEYPHAKVAASAGIGTSIFNLAKGLVSLGHKVSVVVYAQKSDEVFESDGIQIKLVKNVKLKGFSRLLTQMKIQKIIAKMVSGEGLDLIEAPDWTGITSNISAKCPIVVKLHGSDTYFCHLDRRPVKPINKRREKRALQNADAISSVSRYTADVTQQIFGLKKQVEVLPNGVDIDKFLPSGVAPEKGNILYFGTLIRKKGLLELPMIFNLVSEKNPDARLVLVGKDSADVLTGNASTWQMMRELFTPEALSKVSYLGSVPYPEMRARIDRAQVCVFPTFAEALPVSWIEAMAMQKPVVASNIGWAKELIANRTEGFLVHPQAHAEFADRINELLEKPEMAAGMGVRAKQKAVSSFSTEAVATKNEEFYKKVIASLRK